MPYKDPAARAAYMKAYRAKWTPEQRAAHNAKCVAYAKRNQEKRNAYQREWCHKNREKKIEYAIRGNKKWKESDPEAHRECQKRHYVKKRKEKLAAAKKWREANRSRRAHYSATRRNRKVGGLGSHTYEQWIEKVISMQWLCFYCKTQLSIETLTKDHYVPISKQGGDDISNVVPACSECNTKKNALDAAVFMLRLSKFRQLEPQAI